MMPALRSARAAALAALLAVAGATGCNVDSLLFERAAPPPQQAGISLSVAAAPRYALEGTEGTGERVRIVIARPESETIVLDTVLAVDPAIEVVEAFLPVLLAGETETLVLWVEFRRSGQSILRGSTPVLLRRGQSTAVELPLSTVTDAVLEPVAGLSTGVFHTCAVVDEGTAYCWGRNHAGQLGDGRGTDTPVPALVAGDAAFRAIGAGYVHSCGLTVEGGVACWGSNEYGSLGDGSGADSPAPVSVAIVDHVFTQLSVGGLHACALDLRGRAYCWGDGDRGQLGDGTDEDRAVPGLAADGRAFRSISAGYVHTCAIDVEGIAFCWGYNEYGQLGDGTTIDAAFPLPIAAGRGFQAVDAGGLHTCALDDDGRAYCWGYNNRGQLGDGSTTDRVAPIPVAGDLRFASISAGGLHTCAVDLEGHGYCWGYNQRGALGDGSTTDSAVPVPVALGDGTAPIASIHAGLHHTCALFSDATAACWGLGGYGQLGSGAMVDSADPMLVLGPAAGIFAPGLRTPPLDGDALAVLPGH